MKNRSAMIMAALLLLLIFQPVVHSGEMSKVYSVYDKNGSYIFSTTIGISVGDRYINELNREYLIIEVDGQKGIAEFLGIVDLLSEASWNEENGFADAKVATTLTKKTKQIGIYHTHTGEGYFPGEVIKEGFGDIYKVGAAFVKELQAKGINALQSWENHLPHDAAAYDRSRTTAVKFIREGADAIFDVHRDGVPRREEYIAMVGGQVISQIRLVVGRQNPNMNLNDQLARRIKASGDSQFPGLIKGIFYANGKYNQDLSPQALLFEMGTHVTTKEEAIASTAHLATIVNNVLYGKDAPRTRWSLFKSIIKNIVTTLLVFSGGILLYLYVKEGNWHGVKEKLEHFFTVEFKDVLATFKDFSRSNQDKR